jgi:hypothetical protein
MAALEYQILTKILSESAMSVALRQGLSEEHFKDPEAREIWKFLRVHWFSGPTAMTLPSVTAVRRRWPSFQLTALDGTDIRALIEEQRGLAFTNDARNLASRFQELVDLEPIEAVELMHKALSELKARQKTQGDLVTTASLADIAKRYYESAKTGGQMGIPWPWEPLTKDTMGKKPGDLIILYGRAKSMKTWVGLKSAADDYQIFHRRVVVWSKEMNRERMAVRLACILAGVDYQLFKHGALPKHLERIALAYLSNMSQTLINSESELESARRGGADILLLCGRDAPKTLEEVTHHINDFGADVCYFDSFYHMRTARSEDVKQRWNKITLLVEDMKETSEQLMIPFVGITQANRSGEKSQGDTMSDIADSDSISREADLVLRIIKKRGRTLHEDGYEVLTDEQRQEEYPSIIVPPQPAVTRRPLIGMGSLLHQMRHGSVARPLPDKAEAAATEAPSVPATRYCAEIAVALPGNRDGVLEGFMIRAIPGYDFSVLSANYTADDIRKWISEDDKGVTNETPPPTGVKGGSKSINKEKEVSDKLVGWTPAKSYIK